MTRNMDNVHGPRPPCRLGRVRPRGPAPRVDTQVLRGSSASSLGGSHSNAGAAARSGFDGVLCRAGSEEGKEPNQESNTEDTQVQTNYGF